MQGLIFKRRSTPLKTVSLSICIQASRMGTPSIFIMESGLGRMKRVRCKGFGFSLLICRGLSLTGFRDYVVFKLATIV